MADKELIIKQTEIQDQIYTIRDVQVMVDKDQAVLYQVETKILNQAVKRNIDRLPKEFRFQLTREEYEFIRLQDMTIEENLLQEIFILPLQKKFVIYF